MTSRRLRRRFFWAGVLFALTALWLILQVLRAVEALASAARRRGRGGYSSTSSRSSAIFSRRRSALSPARTRSSRPRTREASSTGLKGFVT